MGAEIVVSAAVLAHNDATAAGTDPVAAATAAGVAAGADPAMAVVVAASVAQAVTSQPAG